MACPCDAQCEEYLGVRMSSTRCSAVASLALIFEQPHLLFAPPQLLDFGKGVSELTAPCWVVMWSCALQSIQCGCENSQSVLRSELAVRAVVELLAHHELVKPEEHRRK